MDAHDLALIEERLASGYGLSPSTQLTADVKMLIAGVRDHSRIIEVRDQQMATLEQRVADRDSALRTLEGMALTLLERIRFALGA